MNRVELVSKWAKVLDVETLPKIADRDRRGQTAQLLENTQRELNKSRAEAGMLAEGTAGESGDSENIMGDYGVQTGVASGTSQVKGVDPVVVRLIRQTMPNLMAYNVAGVQAMTGPTGLIFSQRAERVPVNQATGVRGTRENAFYDEVNSGFSGAPITGAHGTDPWAQETNGTAASSYGFGTGMSTADAELLGSISGDAWQEMGFNIDRISVTAKTRALKATYSIELAQDLRAIHGLDADAELANILATEVVAEINREVIRTVYKIAKIGCQTGTTAVGVFDLSTDADGRWAVEKFKGLLFRIEREANIIAKETRRGKANIVICSSDVASALALAGVLDTGLGMNGQRLLQVDDTGNTYAGKLNGGFDVYIDPYAPAGIDFVVVGYKGANNMDAGLFYCPYVPLQMFKAVGPDNFQPVIGFKTRYGMVANPFANGTGIAPTGALTGESNVFFRKFLVKNLTTLVV